MANTLTQSPAMVSYSGATSVAATFAGACTNTSLIVAMVTQEIGDGTFTVADGVNSGNYTQDSYGGAGTGQTGAASIHSIQNTSTSALTVTATIGASTYGSLDVFEVAGAPTSSAIDSAGNGGGTSSNNTITWTVNTSNVSIFCCGTHYPSGAAPDSGYTGAFTEFSPWNAYHYGEYDIDAASGSTTLTFGLGSSNHWSMASAAYKTGGGGGGGGSPAFRLSLLGVGM